MPTHIPLALPACLLGTAPPWGQCVRGRAPEGERWGIRGLDSTSNGSEPVKPGPLLPPACGLGVRRLERRMPGFSTHSGDGVMEKGGRVYTVGRGAAGGEQLTRAALFQALERAWQRGDAPFHPAAPSSVPSPQLHLISKRRSFVRALSPSQLPAF